jgi:transposase-like protein
VIDQRRTVADVTRQLGVVEQTLGNWVRQERIDRGEREGLSSEERARITELERQTRARASPGNCAAVVARSTTSASSA